MKLSIEQLDVASFPTSETPVAQPVFAATAGEDCFSAPWVCIKTRPLTQ